MNFAYSQGEERFRERVRQFINRHKTLEVVAQTHAGGATGPAARMFVHKLAEEGLLGISWPKEYGGKEMPPIYDFILSDECAYAGVPQAGKGVGIIGRALMRHGSESLKREFLPKILNGEVEFAIGYTEPDAGSDLASLRIQAKQDGDDYVINGQKMFCSSAHVAEWVWLLARTDPELPKHKGVSLFLVDLKSPGITIRGIETLGGERTNEVFFDNVRVSNRYLVGERCEGFVYGMEALAFERHVVFPAANANAKFDVLLEWVKTAELGGVRLANDPIVRRAMARLAIDVETSRMHEMNVLAAMVKGEVGDFAAAMHKLYASHLEGRIAETALNMMGAYGQLEPQSSLVQAAGIFNRLLRRSVIRTVAGGSSEIQKNVLAKRHLGLPG